MTDATAGGERRVERGTADPDELLALLNRAFDGWGSRAYFRWKYTAFPEYDPETDDFLVTDDAGRPIAARRIFRRRMRTPDGESTVHVHGGTVVDRAHRGRGHYSALLERSMAFSEATADHVVTFNRAGKLTTDHHLENGWAYLTLPVYTRVISPAAVLGHYVLERDAAKRLARRLARVDRVATRSRVVSRALARAGGLAYGDDGGGGATPAAADAADYDVAVVDGEELGDDLIAELSSHLEAELEAPYRFERSPETIRHAGRYPGARVYTARDAGGDLAAFVVAGLLEKADVTEGRVLEQTWTDPAATRRLFERFEAEARRAGADVLVACTDRRPGSAWLAMGTEYMMWPPTFGDHRLPNSGDAWRLTAYDVL